MKIKMIPTNEVTIEVTPRSAGNYGMFSIGGQERTPESEKQLANEIEREIKRHVENVEYTCVMQRKEFQDEDGNNYESLFDLLDSNFNATVVSYSYRYERKSDNGIGTSGYTNSFPELIETAFKNPFKFEAKNLTQDQKVFLAKVVETGLNSSIEYK